MEVTMIRENLLNALRLAMQRQNELCGYESIFEAGLKEIYNEVANGKQIYLRD